MCLEIPTRSRNPGNREKSEAWELRGKIDEKLDRGAGGDHGETPGSGGIPEKDPDAPKWRRVLRTPTPIPVLGRGVQSAICENSSDLLVFDFSCFSIPAFSHSQFFDSLESVFVFDFLSA